MPRALLLCFTIVAAFQTDLAAAPPLAQVPVSTPVASLAEQLGMDVARDRARFVPEIIRRVYSPPPSRQPSLDALTASPGAADVETRAMVEIPLSASQWSDVVFRRQVPPDELLPAILLDRRAALLCRGLWAADDETLAFYAEHPLLLAFIYERAAPAFSAFAESLHVHDGRLVVPGAEEGETLWRALLNVSPSDPEAFLRALFFEPEARFAYLFDVLAAARPEARAFALGLWMPDAAVREQRFQALGLAVRATFREWRLDEIPFSRPLNDLAILLLRVRVTDRGEPLAPAQRQFWAAALNASPAIDTAGSRGLREHTRIDAAWLLQATAGDMYGRGDKLDQFGFGERVFSDRPDGESDLAASVIREMSTRKMLLLTLERLGLTDPRVYAAGLRQAKEVLQGGANQFWTVVQQQGALAIISRMRVTGTVDDREAQDLVESLFGLTIVDGQFRGAIAGWIQSALSAVLPERDTWEARAVAGLAGGPTPGAPRITWEGETYALDLAFAEEHRLEAIRSRQGGPDLDTGFAIARLGRRAARSSSLDEIRPILADVRALLASAGGSLARPPVSAFAVGVPIPRDGREWLTRSAEELERAIRSGDLRRATRTGESLTELGDIAVAHALVSLVYAVHLGDPDGPALLATNVALRHDFGFNRRDGEGRARGPWALPRQDFQPGVPWHVVGSLLGLDIALAPLGMHRLSMDGLEAPPRLQSIEREAFATNVSLLNPRSLRDIDRDWIVAAIAEGRSRVRALRPGTPDFSRMQNEIALDGWRARTIAWMLQNQPEMVENQFSLAELLVLGRPESAFDAWGASGLLPWGCICSRFPVPRTWRILAGRSQLAMMAATTVEMQLELAQRFAELRLPAALLPSTLETAMQDFVDQVDSVDPSDRMPLIWYPRRIPSTALEDYVAAAATLDGPLVTIDRLDATEP